METKELAETITPRKSAPVPRKMAHLPIDPERGFVVPWFVDWWNGKPEFRAMNRKKFIRAITQRLCWVCGLQLETRFAFVAGPMCGINRTSSEPPSHLECARWSAQHCPFLSNPNMVRRQDEVINNAACRESMAGIGIMRNPGVVMLWITREYEVFDDGTGKHLLMMGRPQEVEWYREGRPATRAEVNASIEDGIGALKAMARQEVGGLEDLAQRRKQFSRFLPAR